MIEGHEEFKKENLTYCTDSFLIYNLTFCTVGYKEKKLD